MQNHSLSWFIVSITAVWPQDQTSVDTYPCYRSVAELLSSLRFTLYISYTNLCLWGRANTPPFSCLWAKRAKENEALRLHLSLLASMGTLGQAVCWIHHHSQLAALNEPVVHFLEWLKKPFVSSVHKEKKIQNIFSTKFLISNHIVWS